MLFIKTNCNNGTIVKIYKNNKKEDKKVYEENSLLVEYEWSERDGSYNITTTEARAKKLKIGLSKKCSKN